MLQRYRMRVQEHDGTIPVVEAVGNTLETAVKVTLLWARERDLGVCHLAITIVEGTAGRRP